MEQYNYEMELAWANNTLNDFKDAVDMSLYTAEQLNEVYNILYDKVCITNTNSHKEQAQVMDSVIDKIFFGD